jgi:hypothetical protein
MWSYEDPSLTAQGMRGETMPFHFSHKRYITILQERERDGKVLMFEMWKIIIKTFTYRVCVGNFRVRNAECGCEKFFMLIHQIRDDIRKCFRSVCSVWEEIILVTRLLKF